MWLVRLDVDGNVLHLKSERKCIEFKIATENPPAIAIRHYANIFFRNGAKFDFNSQSTIIDPAPWFIYVLHIHTKIKTLNAKHSI